IAECLLIGAQAAEPWLSARMISDELQRRCPANASLVAYGVYLHAIPFYTRRRVDKVVNWVGEFDYAKLDPRFGAMFRDDDMIRELGRTGRPACVVLSKKNKDYFASLVPPKNLAFVSFAEGPWSLALLGSAARQADRRVPAVLRAGS